MFTPPTVNIEQYSKCIQEHRVWALALIVGSSGQKQLVPGFDNSIVHNQFSHFLTVNDCLAQEQSGFRPLHSTQTALLDVSDFLLKQMDKGKFVGALFLDLHKAFDTVNHTILLNKLHIIGIRGLEFDWFRSYLCGRTQITKIGNVLSNKSNAINFGVPQGTILGLSLFSIFITGNDITSVTEHTKIVLYADNTSFYSSKDIHQINLYLNHDLQKISN